MSKSRTTSPAKRGRERLTIRRWAVWFDSLPELSALDFSTRQDAKDRAVENGWSDYRIVRVTVAVDPPRRRAGKDKR